MNHSFDAFMGHFGFDRTKAGLVGIERESLIRDKATKRIRPVSPLVLDMIWDQRPDLISRIKPELSRCQLEETTRAERIDMVGTSLEETNAVVTAALAAFGYEPQYTDIGPSTMPLEVYPEPRYEKIAATRPKEQLLAACRIIGIHVHVGMESPEMALAAYNFAIKNLYSLRLRADRTRGARMKLYQAMVPEPEPIPFASWHDHYVHALEHGYADNPRNNWMLVRISRYGTLEFRLFDGVDDIEEIVGIAKECRALCRTFFD